MAKEQKPLTESELAFIKEQTRLLAADLAFYARGPVRLHLLKGSEYGFTYDAGGDGSVINIHLNPSVLLEVHNRERAIKVWRGLGFHELAHHLWPAHEQYKKAAEEGFKDLFNLVDDEQNERRGRSKDPSWGACFQTLVAWVIRKNKKSRWKEVTGEDSDGNSPAKQEAGYVSRFNEFLYHFRRHLPGPKDPVVAEALSLVPPDLKDLSKDELLDLARRLHALLMRGIEAPPPVKPIQPGELKEPEPEKEEEPEEEETGKEKPGGVPVNVPLWLRMARSRWFYLLVAVFVAGWFALFTHKGFGGWDSAFRVTAAATFTTSLLVALALWLESRKGRGARPAAAVKPEPASKPRSLVAVLKSGWHKVRDALKSLVGHVDRFFEKWTPKPVARALDFLFERCARPCWQFVKKIGPFLLRTAKAVWLAMVWSWIRLSKLTMAIWRSQILRALLIAAPVAALLAMIVAVILRTNWIALAVLIIILLLLALLAWLFCKRIKQFVTAAAPPPPGEMPGGEGINDDDGMLEFAVINNIVPIDPEPNALGRMLPDVLPLAHQMRRYLEHTGLVAVDLEDQETGHELVDDIEKAALGESALYVDEHKVPKASVHIEVGIDCSGSMQGDRLELAKRFGLLIEEAIRGMRGISAHFWGFTDKYIYDCGTPGQLRISGLYSSGGNNDSAMLWHMFRSAQTSGKDLRILLMVSDGAPTECTWSSLHNLVARLEMSGYIPVQIAVERIEKPAFQTYFVDLVGQPMESAIIDFGRILLSLVEGHG